MENYSLVYPFILFCGEDRFFLEHTCCSTLERLARGRSGARGCSSSGSSWYNASTGYVDVNKKREALPEPLTQVNNACALT
jgi:hypothetical protein